MSAGHPSDPAGRDRTRCDNNPAGIPAAMQDIFSRAEKFAESIFAGDSGGHDIYHTLRVHAAARRICAEEGGDEKTVRLAALLHDVDDAKLFGNSGYANARRFMDSEGIPGEEQEKIIRIISQISFGGSGSSVPDTLEGKIVQDADRLDAIGAIGIARAFAYGGSRGRPMHIPGEKPRETMSEAEYRSGGTTVNHFREKLLKLKGLMNTESARKMAESRHAYMEGFLEEFLGEWDGKLRCCVYRIIITYSAFKVKSEVRIRILPSVFTKNILISGAVKGSMRITIVGCGSIGQLLAAAADEIAEVKRIYLTDSDRAKAERLASKMKKGIVVEDVEEELYHCDLVIESATQEAARAIIPRVVARGVDIMVMSVGALVDDGFRQSVTAKAAECEAKIYIPSGAVCGTDGLRSSSMGKLDEVELIAIQGPKTLSDVDYITGKGIDVEKLAEKTVVYSGTAREAVQLFPKNVNVAATVSLLGIGFDRTKVTIVMDPDTHSNSYRLRLRGEFGEMDCSTYNVPSPENPKTSYLSAMSAISALKRIVRNEWIGI